MNLTWEMSMKSKIQDLVLGVGWVIHRQLRNERKWLTLDEFLVISYDDTKFNIETNVQT